MKIKFEWTFEVDKDQFPNLSRKEIREQFVACATGYMQQVEEETTNLLEDENVSNQ